MKYNGGFLGSNTANAGIGCFVEKMTSMDVPTYSVSFNFFAKTNVGDADKVAVSLEDGTRLILNTTCYPTMHSVDSYKYSFTILIYGKNLAAVKKSKIVGLKIGNKLGEGIWGFDGYKLTQIIKCMETMK